MIKKKELNVNVLTAARKRIIQVFNSGNYVRMSFSGGKDSIVLADIVYNLCISGQIDKNKLEVMFVDEEAMYDDVIDIVKKWRIKFLHIGVKFNWYCLQVKHYNCLNYLSDEEIFICWDIRQKENWVRNMPEFAIKSHNLLEIGKDNYQSFFTKLDKAEGKVDMVGVRVAESVQRQKNIAAMKSALASNICYPIYDWLDNDIWLYIFKYGIEIPKVYENLYRIGTKANKLRISQFFSIDTAKSLVSLGEMYPDLMEKVIKREPNAYLCSMYWDTEMFGKSTRKRKQLEKQDNKDYRCLVKNMMQQENVDNKQDLISYFRQIVLRFGHAINDNMWKQIYECIITGDPKSRKRRAIFQAINLDYAKKLKGERK